ncbi:ORF111R [Largemouth bass ulcerative syndrome virus]|nr:ORF111R [Largemouth bass ulcerative syndrome virus]
MIWREYRQQHVVVHTWLGVWVDKKINVRHLECTTHIGNVLKPQGVVLPYNDVVHKVHMAVCDKPVCGMWHVGGHVPLVDVLQRLIIVAPVLYVQHSDRLAVSHLHKEKLWQSCAEIVVCSTQSVICTLVHAIATHLPVSGAIFQVSQEIPVSVYNHGIYTRTTSVYKAFTIFKNVAPSLVTACDKA